MNLYHIQVLVPMLYCMYSKHGIMLKQQIFIHK